LADFFLLLRPYIGARPSLGGDESILDCLDDFRQLGRHSSLLGCRITCSVWYTGVRNRGWWRMESAFSLSAPGSCHHPKIVLLGTGRWRSVWKWDKDTRYRCAVGSINECRNCTSTDWIGAGNKTVL